MQRCLKGGTVMRQVLALWCTVASVCAEVPGNASVLPATQHLRARTQAEGASAQARILNPVTQPKSINAQTYLYQGQYTTHWRIRTLRWYGDVVSLMTLQDGGNVYASDQLDQRSRDWQWWLIWPAEDGYFKLSPKRNPNECLNVETQSLLANGNVRIRRCQNITDQKFEFVDVSNFNKGEKYPNPSPVQAGPRFKMKSAANGDYVSTFWDAGVGTWGPSADDSQIWELWASPQVLQMENLKNPTQDDFHRLLEQPSAQHCQFPRVNLDYLRPAPKTPKEVRDLQETDKMLRNIERVSSLSVNDKDFSNKQIQAERSPYYYLMQCSSFQRIIDKDVAAGSADKQTVTTVVGYTKKDYTEISETMGFSVTGTVTGSSSASLQQLDLSQSGTISGELSATYQFERTKREGSETTNTFLRTKVRELNMGGLAGTKEPLFWWAYQQVDQFLLYRQDGTLTNTWTHREEGTGWSSQTINVTALEEQETRDSLLPTTVVRLRNMHSGKKLSMIHATGLVPTASDLAVTLFNSPTSYSVWKVVRLGFEGDMEIVGLQAAENNKFLALCNCVAGHGGYIATVDLADTSLPFARWKVQEVQGPLGSRAVALQNVATGKFLSHCFGCLDSSRDLKDTVFAHEAASNQPWAKWVVERTA